MTWLTTWEEGFL